MASPAAHSPSDDCPRDVTSDAAESRDCAECARGNRLAWLAYLLFAFGTLILLDSVVTVFALCGFPSRSFVPLVIFHPNPATMTVLNLALGGLGVLIIAVSVRLYHRGRDG